MARVSKPKKNVVDEATIAATNAADVFVRSGRERNEASKAYDAAKVTLLEWLGDEFAKVLPDGRTIVKSITDRDGYQVGPGVVTKVSVGPPPAAPSGSGLPAA